MVNKKPDDKIKSQNYLKNRERALLYMKEYNKKNKTRISDYNSKYYQVNKFKIQAYYVKYYEDKKRLNLQQPNIKPEEEFKVDFHYGKWTDYINFKILK